MNGGFEDTPVGAGPGYQQIPAGTPAGFGWTVGGTDVDIVNNSYFGGTWTADAVDGLQHLDLNGFTNGSISQTFATVAGNLYEYEFYVSNNPSGPNGGEAGNFLIQGGAALASLALTHTTAGASPDWTKYVGQFIADGTSATISFTSTSFGASNGLLLDGISVSSVPEPTSMALLGLGVLGGAIRTRRRRKA